MPNNDPLTYDDLRLGLVTFARRGLEAPSTDAPGMSDNEVIGAWLAAALMTADLPIDGDAATMTAAVRAVLEPRITRGWPPEVV